MHQLQSPESLCRPQEPQVSFCVLNFSTGRQRRAANDAAQCRCMPMHAHSSFNVKRALRNSHIVLGLHIWVAPLVRLDGDAVTPMARPPPRRPRTMQGSCCKDYASIRPHTVKEAHCVTLCCPSHSRVSMPVFRVATTTRVSVCGARPPNACSSTGCLACACQ